MNVNSVQLRYVKTDCRCPVCKKIHVRCVDLLDLPRKSGSDYYTTVCWTCLSATYKTQMFKDHMEAEVSLQSKCPFMSRQQIEKTVSSSVNVIQRKRQPK